MNDTKRQSFRLETSTLERLDAYLKEHGLSKSDAYRIALERLLKAKPTKPERERAAYPMGRPKEAD